MIKKLIYSMPSRIFLCVALALAIAQIPILIMASHNGMDFQAQWQADQQSCVWMTLLFGIVAFLPLLGKLDPN